MNYLTVLLVFQFALALGIPLYLVHCYKNDKPMIVINSKKYAILKTENLGGGDLEKPWHKYIFAFLFLATCISFVMGIYISQTSDTITLQNTNTVNVNSIQEAEKKININLCTKEEFQTLEGIGEVKANKFIEKRDEVGMYKSKYDMLKYEIVGVDVFDKIQNLLTVGGD